MIEVMGWLFIAFLTICTILYTAFAVQVIVEVWRNIRRDQ